jgi:hypothetical protein
MLKISRKHIWKKNKKRLFHVINNIIIHMKPDDNSAGDDEYESSDTEDSSDCSSIEDMDCSRHSHCNVNDKCYCPDNSRCVILSSAVKYPPTSYPHSLNTSEFLVHHNWTVHSV